MVFGRVAEDKEVTIVRLEDGLDTKRSVYILHIYIYMYISRNSLQNMKLSICWDLQNLTNFKLQKNFLFADNKLFSALFLKFQYYCLQFWKFDLLTNSYVVMQIFLFIMIIFITIMFSLPNFTFEHYHPF